MLSRLVIQDIVLIDRLEIEFGPGFTALTGETGAGKSILLDALGLILGRRGDVRLVREGADRATVAATFLLDAGHPVHALLIENGLESGGLDAGGEVMVRRVLDRDGRGRAFVNDQPVTVAFLARLGAQLIEIYGQDDRMGLLDPATHRAALDRCGGLARQRQAVEVAFADWRAAEAALETAAADRAETEQARADLTYALDELAMLDPRPGEEAELAGTRSTLMNAARIGEALVAAAAILDADRPIDELLRHAAARVAEVAPLAAGGLDETVAALDRAAEQAGEARATIDQVGRALDAEPGRLESAEERLFALRAQARKHGVPVDDLAALRERLAARLAVLDESEAGLDALRERAAEAGTMFEGAAGALSKDRAKAASRLDKAVNAELAGLRLGRARFVTRLTPLPRDRWNARGAESIGFEVATNPGAAPAPIQKVASGGELSRFMLALRVVLAGRGVAGTLIFDEIDAGIGGAVADAVGSRLARLGEGAQVLVVTHQPQVAARGRAHWSVVKGVKARRARTEIHLLNPTERREEIARMLAGADVTDAARAAADSLILAGAEDAA